MLDGFIDGSPHQSLADISTRLELNKATTFRLLRTLHVSGYLMQDPVSKRYQLSLKMLDCTAPRWTRLTLTARPRRTCSMQHLSDEVEEDVDLNVLDGMSIRSLIRIRSRRALSGGRTGEAFPAEVTSAGKLSLAALSDVEVRALYKRHTFRQFTPHSIGSLAELVTELEWVRTQEYAVANQELEAGLVSDAVAVKAQQAGV